VYSIRLNELALSHQQIRDTEKAIGFDSSDHRFPPAKSNWIVQSTTI